MKANRAFGLKSSMLHPWALVFDHDWVDGQNPVTVLAFIHEEINAPNTAVAYRVTKIRDGKPAETTRIRVSQVAYRFVWHKQRDSEELEKGRAFVVKTMRRLSRPGKRKVHPAAFKAQAALAHKADAMQAVGAADETLG
jgi:hypothetical protein